MKDVHNMLLKKALGFSVKEKVTEYIIEEDGSKRAVKEKEQLKYIPPDISAFKAYMELVGKEDDIEKMTDEEIEQERERLIKSLVQEKNKLKKK